MRLTLLITLLQLFCLQIYAQIQYSVEIDRKINEMGIEVNLPKDQFFNIHLSDVDYKPDFDLELRANDQSYEVRAIFDKISSKMAFRNSIDLDFHKTIAQITNNHIDHNIEVTGYTQSQIKKMNIDYGLRADFIPKDDFSEFNKVRLQYLHKESKGTIIYVILYSDNTPIPTNPLFKFQK